MTSLFKNAQIDRDTEETVNGMRTASDIAEFNDPAAVDRVEASIATAFNTEVLLAKQFADHILPNNRRFHEGVSTIFGNLGLELNLTAIHEKATALAKNERELKDLLEKGELDAEAFLEAVMRNQLERNRLLGDRASDELLAVLNAATGGAYGFLSALEKQQHADMAEERELVASLRATTAGQRNLGVQLVRERERAKSLSQQIDYVGDGPPAMPRSELDRMQAALGRHLTSLETMQAVSLLQQNATETAGDQAAGLETAARTEAASLEREARDRAAADEELEAVLGRITAGQNASQA